MGTGYHEIVTPDMIFIPRSKPDAGAIKYESCGNIFVGDAIGDKIADHTFLPPFYPPFWDPNSFYASINRLKQLEYQSICMAHFCYIYGDEAKNILDEAITIYETWWQLFEKYNGRLGDTTFLREVILNEVQPDVPDMQNKKANIAGQETMIHNYEGLKLAFELSAKGKSDRDVAIGQNANG
jgi:glyoxylase-like metal-dependent hydrolase (beta-lactamase superfamily II)